MFRLILVRHGQTEWNREERFRGRVDIALNDLGWKQAEATGMALTSFGIKAIYTSPLKRAQQTSSIIAKYTNSTVFTLDEITDIDYGQWQGLTPSEAAAKDKTLFDTLTQSPHLVSFPSGESFPGVKERAASAIKKIMVKHPGETVVMVSHKVVCRVLVCHLIGLDLSHFWHIEQDLCALNIFEPRGNLLVASKINDTCHLRTLIE